MTKQTYWNIGLFLLALLLAEIAHAAPNQLSTSSNPALVNQPISLTVQITPQNAVNIVPTGMVTFTDGTQVLGTAALDKTATATFTARFGTIGAHTIVAAYSGDSNFGASNTQPFTQNITANDLFTLSTTPSVLAQKAGSTSTLAVTLFTDGSVTTPVKLNCDQLPPGVTCTFDSASLVPTIPGATTALTLHSTGPAPLAGLAAPPTLTAPPVNQSLVLATLAVVLLPALFLFTPFGRPVLCLLMRSRSPRFALLPAPLALALALIAILFVGCGGNTKILTATPQGLSTVRVIATDGTLTQTSTLQLTVE
jgi:hypothetical protein